MTKRIIQGLATSLIIVAANQAVAAECFTATFPFPTVRSVPDIQFTSCSPSNRARVGAGIDGNEVKFVGASKTGGTQQTFVNGVRADGTAILNCGVRVTGAQKTDFSGCENAVQWRVRMFDT